MNFTTHCQQNNIQLLPDDLKHIRKCLASIPHHKQKEILHKYVEIYQRVMAECECDISGQNLARRSANLYLLGVVSDRTKSGRSAPGEGKVVQ
jgi:hypothetical protein